MFAARVCLVDRDRYLGLMVRGRRPGLRLLLGLAEPTAGRMRVLGQELAR